jgi:hypothetical protein
MKRVTIFAVLIGFFLVSLLLTRPGMTGQQGEKKAAEPASLEQLHKDRITTLEKLAATLRRQYEVGTGTFNEYTKAQDDLFEAKVDAATQPDERIALLEKQVVAAQGVFDFVDARHKMGAITEADSLRAKANLLNVKIRLVREQARKKM